ncbi:uncharacterized protein LOC124810153 isoform X1 [Hydra vulgaris]|uniref:uncharacterized protein LOC124810153 isoform X1 n=1 Tax=Hydra vulgaris TaxID=6087 RepID=UPI001F5FBB7B|nr:uncharacterized protein LOC124810153 [Hydra vulgaris]
MQINSKHLHTSMDPNGESTDFMYIPSIGSSTTQLQIYTQRDAPRPCYYFFRLLGMWQPKNAFIIFKVYNWIMFTLVFINAFFIFMLSYLHSSSFKFAEVFNSIGSILDFCCPFLFVKYYFRYGNFERIIKHIYEQSTEEDLKKLRKMRYIYTFLSFIMWATMSLYFIKHWERFFKNQILSYELTAVIYIQVIVVTMGWWASWLSLYGYVCHIHVHQIKLYDKHMKDTFSKANNTNDECIGHLLFEFNELHHWLELTQKDFSKIISFAVAYHIMDIFVFSYAYWTDSFGKNYPIYNFVGTIFFDTISIAIKLYPAALVCKAVHEIVISVGIECLSNCTSHIPNERFSFYRHLFFIEQDMGFLILGVKITMRLTVGIFVSLATASITFIKFLLPTN